jgi:hypothetical protein
VLILKEVKVVCFDTLLQVLILKILLCRRIAQHARVSQGKTKDSDPLAGSRKQKRQQGCWRRGMGAQDYTSSMISEW